MIYLIDPSVRRNGTVLDKTLHVERLGGQCKVSAPGGLGRVHGINILASSSSPIDVKLQLGY